MRATPVVVAVTLLVLLLTWLSLSAVNSGAERFDVALREMDHFQMLEAALARDVLSTRAGVLRNYDPLGREMDALTASVARLRQIEATDTVTISAIDHLTAAVTLQEQLVEQFKSDNALLQNSLAYWALFSSEWDRSVTPSVDSLAAAMLRLTLDTSPANAREVRGRLDQFASQVASSGDADAARALVAHGRLLIHLLPATDGVLRAFFTTSQTRDREDLLRMILTLQRASRATAREFRMSLYVTSLILVGLLVYLGSRLQARSRGLRRRAAFEHVLTDISVRFIAARAEDIDALIEQALADMARCVGAERAYFLLSGKPIRAYSWCDQAAPFASGWPEQALLLVDRFDSVMDGIVHVPRVTHLPSGANRDTLTARGLRGWMCVSRTAVGGNRTLLGFDAVTHPCRITHPGELGLSRMALDVIVNALDRRSFERERARLELRLQQAGRLETIGTLASGVAHNFNNIVCAILGYTEMAHERQVSSGMLGEIRRAGERAHELVNQILAFARRRDVQRYPVSVRTLIAEATSLLRASLPAAVEIMVRDTTGELIVSAVHAQLQQVILNLCNNAAQSMAYVGRIELETEGHRIPTPRALSHGALTSGQYTCIAVSDSGCGIAEADMERIFEPFFTTRMTGSGLGLATTHDVVLEHGGAMHVRSSVGVGSRFEVWLPQIDAVTSTSIEEVATLPFGRGETVLVIEDDAARLLRDEEIFAALGYEPVGCTRTADARVRCAEALRRFDVVVVGHLVPMAGSLDLATELHEIAPGLPILLATTSADEFGANALAAAGISDVVSWPIVTTELAMALRNCLRQGTSRNEGDTARKGGHTFWLNKAN